MWPPPRVVVEGYGGKREHLPSTIFGRELPVRPLVGACVIDGSDIGIVSSKNSQNSR